MEPTTLSDPETNPPTSRISPVDLPPPPSEGAAERPDRPRAMPVAPDAEAGASFAPDTAHVPGAAGEPSTAPDASPEGGPTLADARPAPKGLKEQFGSTRDAAKELAMAHVDLAKAEASEIGGRVARAAGLVGLAIAFVLLAGMLAIIGTSLFLAEWLFGSMGWGVLHGMLLFTAIATAAVLVAIGVEGRRIGRAFVIAALLGAVVAVILGLDAANRLYTLIGDSLLPTFDPAWRPLLVGIVVGALLGLVLGVILAGTGRGGIGAVIGLAVLGALVGAFTAITFGPQVGIALGIAVGYGAWIGLMGADVASEGIDAERLKDRYTPRQTIDTSKETLEWLRRRMPPGIGS